MKKLTILSLLVLCSCLMAGAQTNFRHISFDEAKAAAKAENKPLFIDFYTDWCGPCKMMANNIFPKKEVGEWMNARFVCIKIDAEKGEGVALAKQYKISAYPTFVVTDSEGKVIGRFTGGRDLDGLKLELEQIIDPTKTPEAVMKSYAEGNRSADIVAAYANIIVDKASKLRDQRKYMAAKEQADSVVMAYFGSLDDEGRMKKENMFVYTKYTREPLQPSTQYLIKNLSRFPEPMRADADSIVRFVYDYAINRYLSGMTKMEPADYAEVKATIKKLGYNKNKQYDAAYKMIEEYAKGDRMGYIDYCTANYKTLTHMQQLYLLQEFANLFKEDSAEVKTKAARFLRNQLADLDCNTMYFVMMQISSLETSGH